MSKNGAPAEQTSKIDNCNSISFLSAKKGFARIDESSSGLVAPSSNLYKYHNYGNVEDEAELKHLSLANSSDDEQDPPSIIPPPITSRSIRSSSSGSASTSSSSIRVQKFPMKLYAILAQKDFHNIITWMPHGRSWKVLKPSMFESVVMPLFFEYSNYHSFNRLVNAWSFRRISSGADRGSYYHELFLRGKPQLHKFMRRLPKTHKKLPMKKGSEPEFYKMDKESPLPALEDTPLPGLNENFLSTMFGPSSIAIKQQKLGSQDLLSIPATTSCSRKFVNMSEILGLQTRCGEPSDLAGISQPLARTLVGQYESSHPFQTATQSSRLSQQNSHQNLFNDGITIAENRDLGEHLLHQQQLFSEESSDTCTNFKCQSGQSLTASPSSIASSSLGSASMPNPLRSSNPFLMLSSHQQLATTMGNLLNPVTTYEAPSDYFTFASAARQTPLPQQLSQVQQTTFPQQQLLMFEQQQQQRFNQFSSTDMLGVAAAVNPIQNYHDGNIEFNKDFNAVLRMQPVANNFSVLYNG